MIHHCNSRCSGGSHHHHYSTPSTSNPKMPNPNNFQIIDVQEFKTHQVILVKYPGVTTFNGIKCLVVKCSLVDLVKTKSLDPHFYDGKRQDGIKIVARFPPDSGGIDNAKGLARALSGGQFKN